MNVSWKRVVTAVVAVTVVSNASVVAAHAAAPRQMVQAAVAANVALRGSAATTTDSSGSVTSKSFSTPSAAVAGDLLVASLTYKTPGLSDIANTAPSGWTKVPGELFDIATTTGSHLVVAVKAAAGGAESATWTFASAPAGLVISVLAYSGADTTIDTATAVYPFEKFGYKVEAGGSNTTTHTAPAFTPTVAGSWGFAAFGARASETWTPGAGLTERSDTKAATSAQATLETADSNGPIATGSPITYSATEPAGTSVQVSFAGNIKPSGVAPPPQAPTVTTGSATGVTSAAATIAGTVNPNGLASTYHFEYGTTTSYGSVAPVPDGSAGSGTTATAVSANLSGLTASTTYHFRLVASNSAGTTNGADATFTTSPVSAPQPPAVTTGSASAITSTTASVSGTINPHGLSTTYHFDYGTTTAYGSRTPTPDASAGAGTTASAVSTGLSGLSATTTYHYRLVATNSAGTTNGLDATFTTTASGGAGFMGPSTSGDGAAATGEKPESRLWWNDGIWWASLFDTVSQTHRIFRLNRATETWVNTGTLIDNRPRTRSDTLWDGTHLYVASHVPASSSSGATAGNPARVYRYSYNSATQTYTLDAGFPAQISNFSSETLTLDKDSTGVLWATWAQGSKVFVNATNGNDASWGTPFVLPLAGASNLDPDDISSVVAFRGDRIGVMWSNQVDSAMYFAIHNDGAAPTTWAERRIAVGGAGMADDHINLKTLQADTSGRVFAAIKTSLDDVGAPQSAPQVLLAVRDPATGNWTVTTVWRIQDCPTRPVVMLDSQHQMVYVFATAPNSGCPFSGSDGTIFMKASPMSNISFPVGRGTPVISDTASPHLNNVTSTKQSVNGTTGLVIMASNDTTQRYWFADIPLGAM